MRLIILLLFIQIVNSLIVLKVKNDYRPANEEYNGEPLATVKIGRNLNTKAISFCFRFQIDGAFSWQTGFSALGLDHYHNFATWFRFPADYGFVYFPFLRVQLQHTDFELGVSGDELVQGDHKTMG